MSVATPEPRLFDAPIAGVYPIDMRQANACLVLWDHKLGPVNRPFHGEAYGLEISGQIVAVATSHSIVNGPVAGFERGEVVELSRLGSANRWSNRVMLRLWREICAPAWQGWPVRAAISYSKNAMHSGDLYRFDGWQKVRDDAGSSGGGTWSTTRQVGDAVHGAKSLWVWRYEDAA